MRSRVGVRRCRCCAVSGFGRNGKSTMNEPRSKRYGAISRDSIRVENGLTPAARGTRHGRSSPKTPAEPGLSPWSTSVRFVDANCLMDRDAQLADLMTQAAAGDSENLASLGFISVCLSEHAHQKSALHPGHRIGVHRSRAVA